MDEWLRSLAVGLAVLTGLVSPPPGLSLEPTALKTADAVYVAAELSGGLPPPARDYLVAGNTLTLVWLARWGEHTVTATRSLTYHAWDRVYTVSDGTSAVDTPSESAALKAWQTWPATKLGARSSFNGLLGQPLWVSVGLASAQESLWGYQRVGVNLHYANWGEVPQ